MKNQLDEQLILLLELVESLSVIVSEIKIHTKAIIDQSVNKLTILKKDDSPMKHSKIGQSDERVIPLLEIMETLSGLLSEISKNTTRRLLNNEFYLTDKEISARLKVSRRTLQEWG